MVYLYNLIFFRPMLNALVFLYQTVALRDLGIAIILLTILIRLILYPIFQKSARHQAVMQRLQPKLKEIQDRHKDNYEERTRASMELFKEHQINPLSGLLLFIIQLPILIALYHIFLNVLKPGFTSGLYSFVTGPETFNPMFLGLINLSESNILMVGLAAVAQYFQGKLATPPGNGKSPAEVMARRMQLIAPAITLLILWRLPAAVALYWLVTTLFSIGQQIIINKQINGELGRAN